MRKVIVSEWVTLDGVFDADPQYFNEWFMPYHSGRRTSRKPSSVAARF